MENLVGRKVKCVKRYKNITKKKEYEIKSVDEHIFEITEDDGINGAWNIRWIKGYDEDGEYHFELLPNEPQFKQGDKVLVSNDKQKWHDRVFVVEHNNLYQCEPLHENISNTLTPWQHIKPYEEEIKVGDWVKNTNEKELILVTKDMNLECLNNESEYIKITNPELIKLLNNEL